jgi:hypothetical protein
MTFLVTLRVGPQLLLFDSIQLLSAQMGEEMGVSWWRQPNCFLLIF